MAEFNASQLRNKSNKPDTDELIGQAAKFKAHPLNVQITDSVTGALVMDTVLQPRGYKAKLDKRSGKVQGGVGWYVGISGEDCGEYAVGDKVFPVSAGLRLSLVGVKLSPTDSVNLIPAGETFIEADSGSDDDIDG